MSAPQNEIAVSRRPPDIEDYLDMLRRYRSWILGPTFAGLVIGVVVAFPWQDTYVSRATMQITPQQVSGALVPNLGASQMADRLQQMETEILSSHGLAEIIQKPSLNLYPKEQKRMPMEDVVLLMKKHIDIQTMAEPVGLVTTKYASAFEIRFSYTDKYKAQAVVREGPGLELAPIA